jgi:thioredoxin-like negative regulator of GroEL
LSAAAEYSTEASETAILEGTMTDVTSLEHLKQVITDQPFVVAYFSRPDCGVCTALKPKVTEIVANLPEANAYYVNLDEMPDAAGEYSIFTIPGIVLFVDGRETIREARYVSADDLESKMHRLHSLRFSL